MSINFSLLCLLSLILPQALQFTACSFKCPTWFELGYSVLK